MVRWPVSIIVIDAVIDAVVVLEKPTSALAVFFISTSSTDVIVGNLLSDVIC